MHINRLTLLLISKFIKTYVKDKKDVPNDKLLDNRKNEDFYNNIDTNEVSRPGDKLMDTETLNNFVQEKADIMSDFASLFFKNCSNIVWFCKYKQYFY